MAYYFEPSREITTAAAAIAEKFLEYRKSFLPNKDHTLSKKIIIYETSLHNITCRYAYYQLQAHLGQFLDFQCELSG